MNARRYEIVTKGMHLYKRRHADCITEVVRIDALSQAGAGHRLRGKEARLQPFSKRFANEWEGDACVVAAATYAPNDHIRIAVRTLHLEQSLLTHNPQVDHDGIAQPPQ